MSSESQPSCPHCKVAMNRVRELKNGHKPTLTVFKCPRCKMAWMGGLYQNRWKFINL